MDIANITDQLPRFLKRQKLIKALLFFSPQSRIQLVRFNDSGRLFADLSDPEPRAYFLAKAYDPDFFRIAMPFLSKGGVFFDVGANFGFCSFGIAGCLPQQDIEYHLFEANSYLARILLRSAGLYPDKKFLVNHYCVTDKDGSSMLKLTGGNLGQSYIAGDGQEKVENISLDEYISGRHIEKINFMKLDIEGHELFALKGAARSLQKGLIEAIYIEVFSKNLSRYDLNPAAVLNLLRSSGYRIFYCRKEVLESGPHDMVNLNVNNNILPLGRVDIDNLPLHMQTDLLAIHEGASVF